jgi:hypothetical protein
VTACLRPDERVEAAEDRLPSARAGHLGSCRRCADEVEALRAALAAVRGVAVPEPPPTFWPALSRRIDVAIAETAAGPPAWWWGRWRLSAPAAALAVVAAAYAAGGSGRSPHDRPWLGGAAPATAPPAATSVAPPPGDGTTTATATPDGHDDALAMVMALADGGTDGDAVVPLAPLADLGEVAAAALTDEELAALEILLRDAVEGPSS